MSLATEGSGVTDTALPEDGRRRAVIESVTPAVDGGRFAVKRTVGETVVVEMDAFTDGHDRLACRVLYRREEDSGWREAEMKPLTNDRWRGSFAVTAIGRWRFTAAAWVDAFLTWRHDLARREDAQDIALALIIGAQLASEAAARASGDDAAELEGYAAGLAADGALEDRRRVALGERLHALMAAYPDRRLETRYDVELPVVVDPERARFSAWYELFPRSAAGGARHGTFADVEARLPYVAEMGFDVLYMPPIHPIGRTARKGPNNTLTSGPGDPGSPWAIGAEEGGHKALHPELGTLDEFRSLLRAARALGIELALDIAFQCAPDHPYVQSDPQWFRWRPDGTVQYAENPPKKYQDIYPFDFESAAWDPLWRELESVVSHWAQEGVQVFRVDNPHTKPFAMWEWLIAEVKRKHPECIFLAEAFTRPRVMHRLAKLGFTQSYNYFPWRNTKQELTEYLTELGHGPGREYFRPSLWPNTPDILPEYLQLGGRPAFVSRLVLAATAGASYGIYGPAYELCENAPRDPGGEEYLDSEKYQLRDWDLERPDSLRELIARVNRIRRQHRALQHDGNIRFLAIDNESLIAYSKHTDDLDEILVMVVNVDPHHVQAGSVELPLADFGLDAARPYQVHDLLSDARYLWHGARNLVRLDPAEAPAHIFRLRRRVRTERDFDYFL